MARVANASKTSKPTVLAREQGRPAKAAATIPTKASKVAAVPKRAPAMTAAIPKVSKDELRAQVERLERTVATLRAKSRETNRAAKIAAARIAELEDQVEQLERKVVLQAAPAKRALKSAPAARGQRKRRDIDPGDAVPPGVAVQEAAPLDEEAETAPENLEEHPGG